MAIEKVPCSQCGSPTVPSKWRKPVLCLDCWAKEQVQKDPFFGLNVSLAKRAHESKEGIEILSGPEKTYFVVNQLIQQVLNGGLHQYFYNLAGSNYLEAENSLIAIGAREEAEILRGAKDLLFPGITVLPDTESRRDMIPFEFEFPGSDWPLKTRELDKRFTKLSDSLIEHLKQFARERGLVAISSSGQLFPGGNDPNAEAAPQRRADE